MSRIDEIDSWVSARTSSAVRTVKSPPRTSLTLSRAASGSAPSSSTTVISETVPPGLNDSGASPVSITVTEVPATDVP